MQILLGLSRLYFGSVLDKLQASFESLKTLSETLPIAANSQHPRSF